MKLLLAFTPFHTPASPPFGLACLKGALAAQRPETAVLIRDWNLAFFRRWLNGEMPDLCHYHPTHLLGTVCPSLLVANSRGRQILDNLSQLPTTPEAQTRYMQAAQMLDDVYNRLAAFYADILFPFVEGRQKLSHKAVDALFGAELAEVAAEKPDVAGFSILAEQNLLYALALGKVIKQRFGIPIALGGAMMSHLDPVELLQAFPWLDFVFFGEAEGSIVEFVDAWPSGDFDGIGGLAFRGENGRINQHQHALPLDLSQLPPPDFGDYPLDDYIAPEPVLPIITSRGCYWGKCTFCSHTRPYGPAVRVRKPEQVIAEMETQMARYGARRFLFVDEAISPRMMRHLTREILARELDVQFGMEGVRVEEAFDEALLRQAHQAGLRWIYVGIESANQRLLDLIEKGITIERVEKLIALCREVGIVPQLSFIVGLPGTTAAELQGEIAFLKQHPMDSSSFVLMLGSPLHLRAEAFGVRVEEQEVLYTTKNGVVHAPRFHFSITEGVSPVQADAMVEAAGPYPKMRPHLGEVHATLLADTDFFHTQERPSPPTVGAEAALQTLARQREETGEVNGRWFLHAAACLEAQERWQEAFTVLQGALAQDNHPAERDGLLLHTAALLNRAGRSQQALALLQNGKKQAIPPVWHTERVRAWYALGDAAKTLREIKAQLKAGYETRWIYYVQGLCLAQSSRLRDAVAALDKAEMRDWLEPDINDAKADLLARMGQTEAARAEREKAGRKRRYLMIDN